MLKVVDRLYAGICQAQLTKQKYQKNRNIFSSNKVQYSQFCGPFLWKEAHFFKEVDIQKEIFVKIRE